MNSETKENQVLVTGDFNYPTDNSITQSQCQFQSETNSDSENFDKEICQEDQQNEVSSEDEQEDDDYEVYSIYETTPSLFHKIHGMKSDRNYPQETSSRTKDKKLKAAEILSEISFSNSSTPRTGRQPHQVKRRNGTILTQDLSNTIKAIYEKNMDTKTSNKRRNAMFCPSDVLNEKNLNSPKYLGEEVLAKKLENSNKRRLGKYFQQEEISKLPIDQIKKEIDNEEMQEIFKVLKKIGANRRRNAVICNKENLVDNCGKDIKLKARQAPLTEENRNLKSLETSKLCNDESEQFLSSVNDFTSRLTEDFTQTASNVQSGKEFRKPSQSQKKRRNGMMCLDGNVDIRNAVNLAYKQGYQSGKNEIGKDIKNVFKMLELLYEKVDGNEKKDPICPCLKELVLEKNCIAKIL